MRWERRLLYSILIVLGIAGVLTSIVVLFSYSTLDRLSATSSTGNIGNPVGSAVWRRGQLSVWLYPADVTPGSRVLIDVGVYGGHRIGISSVSGSLAGVSFDQPGRGASWGDTIIRKQNSGMGSDIARVKLLIPSDSQPGDILDLQLLVNHTIAVSSKGSEFENVDAMASMSLPIHVRSTGDMVLHRMLRAGGALLALVVAFLFIFGLRHLAGEEAVFPESREKVNMLMLPFSGVVTAYCFLGYQIFALPLVTALGQPPDYLSYPLMALWLAGPPALVWRCPSRWFVWKAPIPQWDA